MIIQREILGMIDQIEERAEICEHNFQYSEAQTVGEFYKQIMSTGTCLPLGQKRQWFLLNVADIKRLPVVPFLQ